MYTLKEMRTLPPGKYRLEDNLYLIVRDARRYISFIYTFAQKRREIYLGALSKEVLTVAKQKAAQCRLLLIQGLDPKEVRDDNKKEIERKTVTLHEYYDQLLPIILDAKQLHGANSKRKYTHLPYTYIMPALGDMPIAKITTEDIADFLKPLWLRIPPTALKLRLVLESIFAYAKKEGLYKGDNPAVFKHNLDMYLPPYGKIHETQHQRCTTNEELQHFLKLMAVWHWWFPEALLPLMIMLTVVLASRVNECCNLSWTEINLNNNTIVLPKERKKFKTGDPFVIPLSKQALWIINEIRNLNTNSSTLIFLRNDGTKLHKDNVRKFMGTVCTSLHGTRSNFRNWCARNNISYEVAELSLMHAVSPNATTRSYLRDDFMDMRTEAMQKWADYILPMEVLTASFLTDEQKAKLNAVPYHEKGRGWVGLYNDQWNLGL